MRYLITLLVCLMTFPVAADEQQDKREARFVKMLTGKNLLGSFTVDGKEDQVPKAERYEIKKLEKVEDNLWMFTARIKYGSWDLTVPIQVPVEWAGDTPMVSLTDIAIPGMGSGFSARVLFHDDRYAGTWQHGKVGGCMFGRIETPKKEDAKEQTADSPTAEKNSPADPEPKAKE